MTAPRVNVAIRPVGPFDLGVLAVLHAAGFPDDPWNAVALGTMLAMPGTFGRLAVDAAPGRMPVPLGFVLCRTAADEAEVLTLAVAPAARRAGVGRRLLDAALDEVRRRGAATMFLEVAEDNAAARALYAAAGFSVCGRRPGYYRRATGNVAALVLQKTLER